MADDVGAVSPDSAHGNLLVDRYRSFLAAKAISDPETGLADLPALPAAMFPHQADITRWALRRGRAALFAGTGLGKSLMELAWAQAVHEATGRDILHLAPLAVSAQLAREAENRPADREAFRQLHLNVWLDHSVDPFVEMAIYDHGADPLDLVELETAPCWLGVDLSSNSDLTVVAAC